MGNFANAVTLDTGSVINGILNLGTSTAATLTLDGAGTQLYSTAVKGATTFSGALIKNGAGTWTLDESFTYTGGTAINAGTLQIGNGGMTGSILGNVLDNGALVFNRSDTFAFNGSISGTGSVAQDGSSTLTLAGNNTYSGATAVASGTLQAGSSTAFSANSAYTVTSVLDLNGFNNAIGSLSGNGTVINNGAATATLTVGNDNSNTTFSGTLENGIIAALGLTKVGTGTLILTGNNTYTGGTCFNGGILAINNDGNLGTGALSFNGGTLEALAAGGGITSSKAITLNARGGTFLADAGTSAYLHKLE